MKSARRPKALDEFEAKDELSSYKVRSSGGADGKGPFNTGANEVAGGGGVDSGVGATVGYVYGATVPTDGGGGATDTELTKGGTVFVEIAAG